METTQHTAQPHETTLDRDIRFSPDEIRFGMVALREEMSKRKRSIRRAEANRAAGGRIQNTVLEEHYAALDACESLFLKLEVARLAIARRIADKANGVNRG